MNRLELRWLVGGAVACGVVLLAGWGRVIAAPPGVGADPAPAGNVPSACQVEVHSSARPAVLLLGEEATISHHIADTCAGPLIPLHVALVLDASKSMSGIEMRDAKEAAIQLIRDMALTEHPKRRVGVVQFNTVAQIRCDLTDDVGQAIGCVNAITTGGDTAIDAGIAAGMRVLRAGTGPVEEKDPPLQVMVVLSDGKNNAGCAPVLREAGRAKGQGVVLSTVCAGPSCDAACLRQAASSGQLFYQASNSGMLARIFRYIVEDILEVRARHVNLFSTLAGDMALVSGSSQPPQVGGNTAADDGPRLDQPLVPGAAQRLAWSFHQLPAEGVTVTYRVRPLAAGSRQVTDQLGGDFDDSLQRSGRFSALSPGLLVLQARRLPTPEAGGEATPTPRPR